MTGPIHYRTYVPVGDVGDLEDAASYNHRRYQVLMALETKYKTPAGPDLEIYDDGAGKITIGIGFNIYGPSQTFVREAVFDGMGITLSLARSALHGFLAGEVPVTDGPYKGSYIGSLLGNPAAIQDELDRIAGIPGGFRFTSEAQVVQAYEKINDDATNGYERRLTARLSGITPPVPYSEERIALLSLYFNRPELIGQGLIGALQAGDRAEAWFEIRHNSNGGATRTTLGNGIAKRRYMEAHLFGLYDDIDPASVTLAEATSVYQMLQRHRRQIIADEINWGTDPSTAGQGPWQSGQAGWVPARQIAAASADYAAILTDGPIRTLLHELEPARNALITWLAGQYADLSLVPATYNPIDIQLAPDDTARHLLDALNAVDPTGLSDLNLFGSADGLFAANQAMDIPGVYTITGHGNRRLLLDQRNGGREIRSAAALLREMKGYVVGSGEPIFIGACNLGNGPIPQELANLTGATVYAANGYYRSPTTIPKTGGVAYQPGDKIDLTVNSAQDGKGDAGAFNAVYPEGQSPSDLQPPGRLASVTVRTDTQSASFRVDRITGRIDSQRNAEEDRKKRLGER